MTNSKNKALDARSERLAQKHLVSARLSETTRFIAFGIVALVFTVQSSGGEFSTSYLEVHEIWLNLAGLLGVIAIAADYFQYLFAYLSVQKALSNGEQNYNYDSSHPAYVFQTAFFFLKQVSVGFGAIAIVITFALQVLR